MKTQRVYRANPENFKVTDLGANDLRVIAQIKRIALNLHNLYGLLEKEEINAKTSSTTT